MKAASKMMLVVLLVLSGEAMARKRVKVNGEATERLDLRNDSFEGLSFLIKEYKPDGPGQERLRKETLRQDALILPADKTPVDVVLRRATALLEFLKTSKDAPSFSEEEKALDALRARNKAGLSPEQQKQLFDEIKQVRRKISFKNPLLNFDKILFAKHDKPARGPAHMIDQYLGFNQAMGGGLFVLENAFSDNASVKSLTADSPVSNGRLKGKILEDAGSFQSVELDYDAKTIYFAFTEGKSNIPRIPEEFDPEKLSLLDRLKSASTSQRRYSRLHWYVWDKERNFQIFKMDADGTGLTQLTDSKYNNFDPCVLPNGRIVFISDQVGGNQRCGTRMCSTYTLHGMMPDGSDIVTFSYHDTNEWQPSVDNDGMIVYTRWDYVDRDSDIAHHIWHCFPDGRDPRSYHGNYPKRREDRPWMEMSIRAVPDSHKYVAVSTPHHGHNYGSIVLLDLRVEDDGAMSQVKRVTPEVLFPESEMAPGVQHDKGKQSPKGEVYGQPWPLSEDFHLAVFDSQQKNYGLYLVDSFGNKELLYRDPEIACLDPIPFRPRKRPPVIPVRTQQAKVDQDENFDPAMGTVTIMNIYESKYPWPEGTKIKELRVINMFPKPNETMDGPYVGPAQSLARGVLGTVPVEEDGSVHFECPTSVPIYFQALDDKGMMVQNMRSITYLHPGETLSCIGCHEKKSSTPENIGSKTPMALKRPPSKLKKEVEGSYPLTFPRLVQPVLDKHCVRCHNKTKKRSMRSDEFIAVKGGSKRSLAYNTLMKHAWGKKGGNGALAANGRSYSIPGQEGARVSKLYERLMNGHSDVKLSPEEMRRIALWMDCNSNYFGAYMETEKQHKGEIVKPLLGVPPYCDFDTLKR